MYNYLIIRARWAPGITGDIVKVLSIRQPYAWLIVNGYKDIENRTWATSFRGEVLIHAGLTYPKGEYRDDAAEHDGYPAREDMIGGIVGIATITDCVSHSDSEWFFGPYKFALKAARPLPFTPCKGALGFFDVPLEIDAILRPHYNFEA